MGASCGYSYLIRESLAHVECMVDESSWSPQLDGCVGGIFTLRLKYGHEI
jgi:hypothetical protein